MAAVFVPRGTGVVCATVAFATQYKRYMNQGSWSFNCSNEPRRQQLISRSSGDQYSMKIR